MSIYLLLSFATGLFYRDMYAGIVVAVGFMSLWSLQSVFVLSEDKLDAPLSGPRLTLPGLLGGAMMAGNSLAIYLFAIEFLPVQPNQFLLQVFASILVGFTVGYVVFNFLIGKQQRYIFLSYLTLISVVPPVMLYLVVLMSALLAGKVPVGLSSGSLLDLALTWSGMVLLWSTMPICYLVVMYKRYAALRQRNEWQAEMDAMAELD